MGRMDRTRIGEIVRSRRTAMKLSLRRAAELSSGTVSHSTWGQIETGDSNATVDMLTSVAATLGCRWEHRLVPNGTGGTVRSEMLDRLTAIIDLLQERDARLLLSQIEHYERELGIRREGE